MKKLLYLVPIVLILLSVTPIALYKDKVDFLLAKNPNAKIDDLASALTKLSPSHWKMLNFNTSASGSLGSISFPTDSPDGVTMSGNQSPATPKPEPLYEGATFRGFPIAAYFSKDSDTNSGGFTGSTQASGYSWLWATVDGLLVLVSLAVAFKVNRQQK